VDAYRYVTLSKRTNKPAIHATDITKANRFTKCSRQRSEISDDQRRELTFRKSSICSRVISPINVRIKIRTPRRVPSADRRRTIAVLVFVKPPKSESFGALLAALRAECEGQNNKD
jgi:hypothetical protein